MIAGLFNRILGFILRIILVRIIGDEGLGLFQMVFPIFVTFSIITTVGLPIAISKFVSQKIAKNHYQTALKILKLSIIIISITSLIVIFLFTTHANLIANKILNDSRTYYILLAIAPALFFVSIASALRGFFQGLRIMTPTAISQIIEQITRMIVTLLILMKLMNSSLEYQAMGAAIGITAGEGMGLLTLIIIYLYHLPQFNNQQFNSPTESSFQLIKKLIKFGVPITFGKLIVSSMYSIEAITIPGKLQEVGYSISTATSLYGQLSGMVQQLIYLPTIMTIALNSNLIPAISEATAQNQKQAIKNQAQQAIRLTIYLGLLPVIVLFLLPEQICDLFFKHPQAGVPLKILSISAIFLYLSQIFSGIIQGLGKPNLVVKNSIIGIIIELLIIHSIVYFSDIAFPLVTWAIGIRYITVAILNFKSILSHIKLNLPINQLFVKPLLAGGLVFLILPQTYQLIYYLSNNNLVSILVSCLLSTSFYFAFLILTNGITQQDLDRIKP